MKETTKTSRTAGYLEKIFRDLNTDYFKNELEEPIITIQSTKRAYGHVSVAKAWKRKDDWRHELNLGAESLDRPIENVVTTIMHEMVHLHNIAHNIQDCSRGGMYHNRKFRDEAERHALHVEHHPAYGWTITSPTEELLNYIIEKGWTDIKMNRDEGIWTPPPSSGAKAGSGNEDAGTAPKKSSTRKYICPKCGQSIRATRTVNIICGDCMMKMEEA